MLQLPPLILQWLQLKLLPRPKWSRTCPLPQKGSKEVECLGWRLAYVECACVCVCCMCVCVCVVCALACVLHALEAAIFSMEPISTRQAANCGSTTALRGFSCWGCSYNLPLKMSHSHATHKHTHIYTQAASAELWPCARVLHEQQQQRRQQEQQQE